MSKKIDKFIPQMLDQLKQTKNGVEFWSAREIQTVFWYKTWQWFKALVHRTEKSIEILWESKEAHITHVRKVSALADW